MSEDRQAWVKRVLGIDIGSAGPPDADIGALTAELAGLIRRVPEAAGTDDGRRKMLSGLANAAGLAVKARDPAQAAAALRALDAALSSPAGGAARVKTMAVWQDARDTTNSQISKLQDAMRGTRHPMFLRIADRGLNGFTGRSFVGLQVALMDLDSASGEARTAASDKARAAVGTVRGFIQGHPVVPLLERNPFKVPVTLRAVLLPALDQIEQSLGARV